MSPRQYGTVTAREQGVIGASSVSARSPDGGHEGPGEALTGSRSAHYGGSVTDESLRTSISMAALAGGTVAVWTALPEYVEGRWTRLAARAALLTVSSIGVALIDDEPTPRPDRDEKMASLSRALEDPAQRAAIWMIGLVGLSAISAVEHRMLDAAAARIRARGVRAPRTMLGLGLGAVAAGTQLAPTPKE